MFIIMSNINSLTIWSTRDITHSQQGGRCLEKPVEQYGCLEYCTATTHNTSATTESDLKWPTLLMMSVL